MEELLRYNFNQKYIVVDTETEGLNLLSSKPWQISWITYQGKKEIEENNRFLYWDNLNISDEAASVTGFNRENYLENAEDPRVVFQDLSKYIFNDDYIIVGQNLLGYDIYIIGVLMELLNMEKNYLFIDRIIDTKALAMAIAKGIKNIPSNQRERLIFQLKYLNHVEKGIRTNQKHLLKTYEIDFKEENLHDAIWDVRYCFQIFWKQINQLDI